MKFGKEFVSQMVPEWQEAYMDYNYLKSLVKEIQSFNLGNKTPTCLTQTISTSFTPYSGLLQEQNSIVNDNDGGGGDIEDQVILVKPKESEGHSGYETEFQFSSDAGVEYDVVFFRRLDEEFDKVNCFYKGKVEEVLKEAALLNKQMDALVMFRIRVEKPDGSFDWSIKMRQFRSDVTATAARVSDSAPNGARKSDVPTDLEEKVERSSGERSDESGEDTEASDTPRSMNSITSNSTISSPFAILDKVKMNNTTGTPLSTLKGILNVDRNKQLSFRKESLRKAKEQLKSAFIEFYRKLRLLKNYSFLNLLAFSKIMKKYDKATSRKASVSYMDMVDKSYLSNSDDVTRLTARVEDTFVKHFANSNRSAGMNILRSKVKKERHVTSFSLGVFTGCTLALLVSLILIIQFRKLLRREGFDQYMQNMFPLYSLFGFVTLHMLMYAINIYFWRRYRVNYTFIFGFKQGTELGYREVFLLSTGLATLTLASVLANLDMEMDERSKDYIAFTELVPLGLLALVLIITICPFNIIYRSSRFFLLKCAFRCICAPLYKVTIADFFLADQLTSQVQAIRSLEFFICYYGWGDFKLRQNTCESNDVYKTFYFIVGMIPNWSRMFQCFRTFYTEKDSIQGYNGLKHLSTVVAVLVRAGYTTQSGHLWYVMAWVTSTIATIYNIYWDVIFDWGLLQRNSKNRWLRDKLVLPQKSVYFIVMVLNFVLRLAWLVSVFNFPVFSLHSEAIVTIFASLEIIRRGIWNFFRLENEHLNNVGKFRAVKSVPLPFNYDEDKDL